MTSSYDTLSQAIAFDTRLVTDKIKVRSERQDLAHPVWINQSIS